MDLNTETVTVAFRKTRLYIAEAKCYVFVGVVEPCHFSSWSILARVHSNCSDTIVCLYLGFDPFYSRRFYSKFWFHFIVHFNFFSQNKYWLIDHPIDSDVWAGASTYYLHIPFQPSVTFHIETNNLFWLLYETGYWGETGYAGQVADRRM